METIVETKNLKMHRKLLFDVIKNQAGTLQKAILEGVMNSIEAGTSRVDINLIVNEIENTAVLNIKDNGRGIPTEEELIEHFETFGTPHSDSENKVWARFRMGRGQLFAFGKNTWRTSTFQMEVDIDKWGLKYELTKNLPRVEGCDITIVLYENPIGNWECSSINRFKEEIRKLVEYVHIPVFFNEEQINTPPYALTWTHEDENAYYLFGAGSDLKIYNLGAFVRMRYIYETGVAGVIVSKKPLDVNFARNDIKNSCPVYRDINEVIRQNRIKETKKQKKYTAMSPQQRLALLRDLRDGVQPYCNLRGKRIFRTSQGKWLTLNMIFESGQVWAFAPDGSRAADRCIQNGSALCLSDNILFDLSYRGERAGFFDWLLKEQLREKPDADCQNTYYWERDEVKKNIIRKTKSYIAYNIDELGKGGSGKCLTDGFSSEYINIPNNKLTIIEKRILKALESFNCWDDRRLSLGVSDEASAWTNGETYIVIERTFLRRLNLQNKYKIHKLFAIMVHELSHDGDTEGTHGHTPEFDARFREIIESDISPYTYITDFITKMRQQRIEKRKLDMIEKQMKAEESVKKKLGIGIAAKNK